MPIEQYANDYVTTLNGGITDTQTTLTLTSATGAPVAPFRLRIENELMLVGARSGTACSVITRGVEGSANVAHLTGVTVEQDLTRAGMFNARGVYDVRAYGATGDGSTNDAAAIQAAIDALPAYSGGFGRGTVYFPAGKYNVGGTAINLNTSGIILHGAGLHTTQVFGSIAGPIFDTPYTAASDPILTFLQMHDMWVSNNNTGASSSAVRLREFGVCTFTKVRFSTDGGAGSVIFYSPGPNILLTFRNCDFIGYGGLQDWGLTLGTVSWNNLVRIEDCSFQSSKGGLHAYVGAALTAIGNHFENLPGSAGGKPAFALNAWDGGVIHGNHFEGNGDGGLKTNVHSEPSFGFDIAGNYHMDNASPQMDLRNITDTHVGSNNFKTGATFPNADCVNVNDAAAARISIEPQYLFNGSGAKVVRLAAGVGTIDHGGFGPFVTAGVPATSMNGIAEKGALCADTTNGKLYINTGTKASNTWTVVGTQT